MIFVVLHKKEAGQTFGASESANRIAVPIDAILAIYDDKNGAVVSCDRGIGTLSVTEKFDDILEIMGGKRGGS